MCKPPSKLAKNIQKIFKISDHTYVGITGLNADARILTKYLR